MKALLPALMFALVACTVPEPLDAPGRASWLVRATEPIYEVRPNGRIGPIACGTGQPSSYANAPAGCVLDSALAAHVVNPQDLINPPQPGPPYAAPAAAAAYDYLYGRRARGGDTVLTLGGDNAGGRGGGQVVDVPPDGAAGTAP